MPGGNPLSQADFDGKSRDFTAPMRPEGGRAPQRFEFPDLIRSFGPDRGTLQRVPRYLVACLLLGIAFGALPALVHGPIPEKFNVLHIRGAIAIWTFYAARLSIGFLVGISVWPPAWWLRGPLLGLVAMTPPALLALATPRCGPT
jgi:hypothetical protein